GDHFAHQLICDADAAAFCDGVGEFFGLHGAPGFFTEPATEILIGLEAGEHLLGEHGEEHAFHFFGLLADTQHLLRIDAAGGVDFGHHSTSISAWRAPVTLMACRMAIRSRGEMPRALRPSTNCCSVTVSGTSWSAVSNWLTLSVVLGSTAVWPRLSGLGCTTSGFSAMVTVRLDWATATAETRTSLPMTMMPEFSSMTTLAGWSVCTINCSISVSRSTILPLKPRGRVRRTVAGSSGTAVGTPIKSFTARAIRRAVVRSGLRRARRSECCEPRWKSI